MSTLNRTAAEIAAAALCEIFPDVKLLGGGDTSVGFYYDFSFPHSTSPQVEVFIEERMRQIARERRGIRTLEMVPRIAREFLIKEGRSSRVHEIDPDAILVEMIQIGSFVDLSSGPHLKNSHELSSFKLWPLEVLEKGEYRLSGCAFAKKEDLKNFLKKFKAYKETSHLSVGLAKSLWRIWEGEVLWLKNGLKGRSDLIAFLKSHLFENCLEIGSASLLDRVDLHGSLAAEMKQFPFHLAEIYETPLALWDPDSGLLAGEGGGVIQISSYGSSDELQAALISSLQSVGKTLNILGFKYYPLLVRRSQQEKGGQRLKKSLEALGIEFEVELEERAASRIDLLVEDNLGRRWAAFSWLLVEKGFYVTGSIERLYALLLEISV